MVEDLNENKIGLSKGTELEEIAKANFKGETTEVGLYLAMARCAQREGFPEVAEVFKTLAFEEAGHAARFAEFNAEISISTKENLEYMLKGETMANREKREAAMKAKDAGLDGVVSSVWEAEAIRRAVGEQFVIVTPGIRPQDSAIGDQKRVATPRDALLAGADYIVVGRPITKSTSPRDEAVAILEELEKGALE